MLSHLGRAELFTVSTATTGVLGFAIAPEHLGVVSGAVALVGMVVGAVAWFDARIDAKLKQHCEEDKLRADAIHQELRHMRDLLSIHFGLPSTKDDI